MGTMPVLDRLDDATAYRFLVEREDMDKGRPHTDDDATVTDVAMVRDVNGETVTVYEHKLPDTHPNIIKRWYTVVYMGMEMRTRNGCCAWLMFGAALDIARWIACK